MSTQLRLINGGEIPLRGHPAPRARPWRLDPKTRATGRKGVARARQELKKARPNIPDGLRRAG